jgi:glycosyltransferase involved in cell wall biosynthesis
MKVMSLVGIVVPFFSNEAYLHEMLCSLESQTSADWVCVVVDDSGRENQAKLTVGSLANQRITYIKNETNLGLAKCWNVGLEHLSANFSPSIVAVVHADDVLEANFIEASQTAHSDNPNAIAVHTSVTVVDEENKKRFSFPDFVKFHVAPYKHSRSISTSGDSGLASVLRGNFVFCPTVSFKTELISLPLFNPQWNMAVDLELISRLLLDGQTIVGIPDFVYRYRRHRNNLTSQLTDTTVRFVEEISFYKQIAVKCTQKGFDKSAIVASRLTMVRLHIMYRILQKLIGFDLRAARKLLAVLRTTRQ